MEAKSVKRAFCFSCCCGKPRLIPKNRLRRKHVMATPSPPTPQAGPPKAQNTSNHRLGREVSQELHSHIQDSLGPYGDHAAQWAG